MTISPFRETYKHELRTEILRLAREEFVHEEGYAGSSMRRVAEQVGGVPSAIQPLCKQREISDCLVEESFAALMRAPVSVKYLPGEDPINRLKRAMRAYVPFGLVNPDDCRLGFVLQRPENNRPQAPNFAYDGLKSRIGKCIAAGYFANGDMDLIAQSLWAPVHGITSRIIQSRSSLSSIMSGFISQIIDAAVASLMRTTAKKRKEHMTSLPLVSETAASRLLIDVGKPEYRNPNFSCRHALRFTGEYLSFISLRLRR